MSSEWYCDVGKESLHVLTENTFFKREGFGIESSSSSIKLATAALNYISISTIKYSFPSSRNK